MTGDDQTVLDSVLSADYRRSRLLEEQEILTAKANSVEEEFTQADEERLNAVHRKLFRT